MKRIVELDGVRTVAVAGVIACHFAPFSNWFGQIPAHYGGLGVDIFFVLSGFLITTILLELKHAEHPYKVFYARRFIRIMPPYILLLVIVYGIALFAHDPIEPEKFFGQILFLRSFLNIGSDLHRLVAVIHHPSLIPNPFAITFNKFVEPDYPILPITGALGPTWSLSVEEWFYVLWAPVVLLLNRTWIVAVGIAMCVAGFLLRWIISPPSMILRSSDILIAGALLALWIEHRRSLDATTQRRNDLLFGIASALSGVIYLLLVIAHRELVSMTFAEFAFAGAVGWLILHAGSSNPVSWFLRLKPMVYLGSISYMLYLIHLPMYFLVRAGVTHVAGDVNQEARYWIVSITTAVLSVAFSAASWKFYESPILKHKDRFTDWVLGRKEQLVTVDSTH
jgi:peptidoglycan/LPS O-acetylase OafA/YrhL